MREVQVTIHNGVRYCADCGACVDSDLPAAVGLCDCEPSNDTNGDDYEIDAGTG